MNFVWFAFIAYGLTQILVYGKVFNKIRPTQGWVGELLSCPMCTGFWVGIFLWLISGYTELINFDDSWVTALLCGFSSSGASYILNMIFGDEGLKLNYIKGGKDVTSNY